VTGATTTLPTLGAVAEMLRADIHVEHLTNAAQQLVANLLAGRNGEGRWYWAARDFLAKSDLGRNDQQVRTLLATEYGISPTLALEPSTHPLWSCWSPAQVRALPAAEVPYLANRVPKTRAFNLIADLDAASGQLIAFLDTFWAKSSRGEDLPTFGQLLDAYTAAC
jgi:hypothetical protein